MSDGTRICDTGAGACVYDSNGRAKARYRAGSFFKGLSRPWMGLHTIDTVRRDAGEQEVWFETKPLTDSEHVEVILDCGQVKLVYTIDMETDVIDKISFVGADGAVGEMRFFYLQDIADIGSEFKAPRAIGRRAARQQDQGMLWLAKLLNKD